MTEYILTVNDTFRVNAPDAETAEKILLARIGQEPFEVYDVQVVDILP